MLRNYLTVAFRFFYRHKLYSFINVVGLAVGLACAIFILLYLRDELSFDAWEPNSKNVYQLATAFDFPGAGAKMQTGSAPFPLGPAMKDSIAGVDAQTHLRTDKRTVRIGNKLFAEVVQFADPNFFDVIQLPFAAGERTHALESPESIVLTRNQARKYFGLVDPMGRTLYVGNTVLTVSAVLEDPPHNSQFQGTIYISNKSSAETYGDRQSWFNLPCMAFVRLAATADTNGIQDKIKFILRRNADPRSIINTTATGDQILKIRLIRLSDAHIEQSDGASPQLHGSGRTMVYGFSIIAVLILAIAAFNFTNLATAQSTIRSREVALRKVVGAKRHQLVSQFFCESILTALIALILALAVVEILLPRFNALLNRAISFQYLQDWPMTLVFIAIAAITGLLGGIYPALVLSNFRPSDILKTGQAGYARHGRLRTTLIILQFAISIALAITACEVYAQIRYARNIDLGYNHNNILVLDDAYNLSNAARKSLMDRLASGPNILGVAGSSTAPMDGMFQATFVSTANNRQNISTRIISVEPSFFRVYGIRLLAGRLLDEKYGGDIVTKMGDSGNIDENKNIVIDAAMARTLGFTPQGAIGKTIWAGTSKHLPVRIVGVVAAAKYFGVIRTEDPIIYTYRPGMIYTISIVLRSGHIAETLNAVDHAWHDAAPTIAIRRHFIDDSFDKVYRSVERQGILFALFVGIAIFIASLGLFGLAAFTVERRTKEIGVRKIFGATTGALVGLLLWQFSIPILIANLIAWPTAWLYLNIWLEGFAYRIQLSTYGFLAVGLVALLIAWATVIAHVLHIARQLPAKALRYE